jgi:hypothetical protein
MANKITIYAQVQKARSAVAFRACSINKNPPKDLPSSSCRSEAFKEALSDDIDWDTQEMESDSARTTTITEAKVIPEGI